MWETTSTEWREVCREEESHTTDDWGDDATRIWGGCDFWRPSMGWQRFHWKGGKVREVVAAVTPILVHVCLRRKCMNWPPGEKRGGPALQNTCFDILHWGQLVAEAWEHCYSGCFFSLDKNDLFCGRSGVDFHAILSAWDFAIDAGLYKKPHYLERTILVVLLHTYRPSTLLDSKWRIW